MEEARHPPDWERIECDFRAGLLSLREIAGRDGNVTEGAIRKRAKRDGWTRDLGAKIQAKADDLVRKEAVRSSVRNDNPVAERVLIEANAQVVAQVRSQHRLDIGRARALVAKLLAEIEAQTTEPELFARLGELMASDSGRDRANDLYQRVIGLGGRITNLKALTESLKNLVALEREAYGIENAPPPPPGSQDGGTGLRTLTDDELYAIAACGDS